MTKNLLLGALLCAAAAASSAQPATQDAHLTRVATAAPAGKHSGKAHHKRHHHHKGGKKKAAPRGPAGR